MDQHSVDLLRSINKGICELNVQMAVSNERMEQLQKADAEHQKALIDHADRIVVLEKAEDKNGTARAAAWLAAISLAGMLIISAWDSWEARVQEKAAEAVKNAEARH